jgi:excisionase family DNA binding protein
MFNEYPDIMNVEQVAEALRIGRNSAYKLVKEKVIGSKRIGRKYLVPKSCVIDYVQSARYTVVKP